MDRATHPSGLPPTCLLGDWGATSARPQVQLLQTAKMFLRSYCETEGQFPKRFLKNDPASRRSMPAPTLRFQESPCATRRLYSPPRFLHPFMQHRLADPHTMCQAQFPGLEESTKRFLQATQNPLGEDG